MVGGRVDSHSPLGDTRRAVSQENVELVRAIIAPWRHGDFRSAEWAHPEIEFGFGDGPTPGSWTGIDAMSDAWREALGAFDRLEMDADDCVSIDSERVLVLTTNTGRGKTSGFDLGELRTRGANIFHIRDGKVTKLVAYWDRDRALEALGLSQQKENVEIVRRFVEAARSGDADAIEAFLAVSDPSIEHTRLSAASGPETYRGHDGVRRWFTDMADLWRDWRNEIEELVAAGPDTVAARVRFIAVGRDSGVPVEARLGLVCVLSKGRILRSRTYASGEAALEAVRRDD